jgi:outer membrane protein
MGILSRIKRHNTPCIGRMLGILLALLGIGASVRGNDGPNPPPVPLPPVYSPANPGLPAQPAGNPALAQIQPAPLPPPTAKLAEQIPIPDGPGFALQDAIRLALANNPDLDAAERRIAFAEALLDRARSEFYPQLGISEAYGVTNNPVNAFMFLLNEAQFTLNRNLNHPGGVDDFHTQTLWQYQLYDAGRRDAMLSAAEFGRTAAGFELAAAQNALVFQVAEAYYRLFQARELVGVRREAVGQIEKHLDLVQIRARAGTAVRSDVLTVEVRLAEARENLISAGNREELTWLILQNICGASLPRQNLPRQIPAGPWGAHVDQVEAAVNEARSHRPEIGVICSQMQAAEQNVRAAEAGKYPSVNSVADYDVYTGDFHRGNDSFFVGVVANLTLFDGARTKNDIRKAEEKLTELHANHRRLMLDIELSVRRAYLQLDDARRRLQVSAQAIAQAEESLREIEVRYRSQTATITQLIDAQVALSNTRVRHADAQAAIEIARASLEQATGRLLNALQP